MTCNNCVAKVKSELLKLGDVAEAEVQLKTPQAVLSMTRHIPIQKLQDAISKAGQFTVKETIPHSTSKNVHMDVVDDEQISYYPIFLIFGFIGGITLLVQVVKGSFSWMQWMSHFMSGFFFVFSFFKFLDIKGFAEGYRSYDLIARKFRAWGFIYPFIELALGISFLVGLAPLGTNIVTFIIMTIGAIGIARSLINKNQIQCSCLGTVIKLPLGKVSLFEDLAMIGMSLIMIIAIL